MRRVLLLLLLPVVNVAADPGIYRCAQADGTIAFQELPCPATTDDSDGDSQNESNEPQTADGPADFVNPFDEAQETSASRKTEPQAPVSRDRADCEKQTRDAIDAIDLELRKGYTKEEGQRYLADLLELTQQLRACKTL